MNQKEQNMNNNCFISIWLPNLSIDLILMENPQLKYKPLCILRMYRKQRIIFKLNHKYRSSNLVQGMKLTDALTVEPDLIVKKDLPLERKKFYLNKIIFWLSSITPRISIAKNSTLILDVPCTFRSSYTEKIRSVFENSNITNHIGVANTVGAAWAKSHFSEKDRLENSINDSISNLPIKSLRISHRSVKKLNSVGIETISQLAKVPKTELYLRFDNEVSSFFDKATGKEGEPFLAIKTEPKFQIKIDLSEHPSCKYQVISLTKKIIMDLCIKLKSSHVNAQIIKIIFNSERKLHRIIEVSLAKPSNSHTHIVSIFAAKLLRQKDIPEIHSIKVEILKTYPTIHEQKELLDSTISKEKKATLSEIDNNNICQLVEKLGIRLGKDSVNIFSPRESHIPEKSYILKIPGHYLKTNDWPMQYKPRPKILFEPQPIIVLKQISKLDSQVPPKLFWWGDKKYEVLKAIGPERISLDWWLVKRNHENSERDYWQVKSACGSHLWLFNLKKKFEVNACRDQWLIQGQFC